MFGFLRHGRQTLQFALNNAKPRCYTALQFLTLPSSRKCLSSNSHLLNITLKNCGNSQGMLKQLRFFSDDVPRHVKVALPALSPTMELGTIVSWQKKEGDQLSEGDLLCEIETDKATMGFETPEEGYLAKIFVPEGAKDIPIGKLLCIIVENKDDIEAFKNYTPPAESGAALASTPAASKSVTPQAVGAPPSPSQQPPTPQPSVISNLAANVDDNATRIKVTPYARKVAKEAGVDLLTLSGSGPGGRILSKDVSEGKTQAETGTFGVPHGATSDYEDISLSNMRKTIAKRLTESKSQIPHYYLTSEIVIDKLIDVRAKLNTMLAKDAEKGGRKPVKLSINDFIVKASALSCVRVPEANSFFMDTFIRQNNNVDVSVAVSTDVGLITPIIFNAHHKGVATISSEVSTLAGKAREGKLQPHEFQGGTFTVSNLGMFGSIDHFTAIINPPQSCILAIGGAKRKLVPSDEEGDEHKVVTALKVTLSCDHRVVDGAIGAVWLRHFKTFLENPHAMLL